MTLRVSWSISFTTFRRPPIPIRTIGFLLLLLPCTAAAQTELVPHPSSRFWIQGEATTHNFTCVVEEVEGSALVPAVRDSLPTHATESQTEVIVRVPIRAVDCGNSRMTDDLQETLEMKEHPEIRFELVHATMGTATDTSAQWQQVDVLGPLTISGTKRLTRVHAAARAHSDEHYRVRGCLPIRMTYFGIDPPTKALGLIRVKNRVEVQYDIRAHPASTTETTHFDTLPHPPPPTCHE